MPKSLNFSELQQKIIKLKLSGSDNVDVIRMLGCAKSHILSTMRRYRRADSASDHMRLVRMEDALYEILAIVRRLASVSHGMSPPERETLDKEFRVRQAKTGKVSAFLDESTTITQL